MLRIGLFVPAEWNFGGMPAWLHCIPTMVFWTDNEPFKSHMNEGAAARDDYGHFPLKLASNLYLGSVWRRIEWTNWLKFGRMAALCECLARFARVAVSALPCFSHNHGRQIWQYVVTMVVVVMEFIVYVEYELSHIPQAYLNDRPGTMTFVEPHQVEWWTLADVLSTFGYKGNADVYYIKPGCIPPEGMVELLGQDDVDKLMHDHEGLKKCDLIVVKNYPCSDDDMNGQDMYGENMYGCDFLDTGNDRYLDMNRQDIYEETRDPCESPDRTERDSNEDGSSPRKKKRGRNNRKKSLDFGSSDEPLQ